MCADCSDDFLDDQTWHNHMADAVLSELSLRMQWGVAIEDAYGEFICCSGDEPVSAVGEGEYLVTRCVTDWSKL
jgi:hypothetical protein